MLLKLLEDKNGEVQNLAVKWYWKTRFFSNLMRAVTAGSLIESLRSKKLMIYKDEFVCLVIVCTGNCPWNVTHAGGKLVVGGWPTTKFLGKVVFRRTRCTNVSFVLPTCQKSLRLHLHVVCHPVHYCVCNVNFFLENVKKKNQCKECETDCFQYKVTIFMNTMTSSNTNYKTSCGQTHICLGSCSQI